MHLGDMLLDVLETLGAMRTLLLLHLV
jgi:hypothetical protein